MGSRKQVNGDHRKLSKSSITKIQALSDEDLENVHNIREMTHLLNTLEYPEPEVILREANKLVRDVRGRRVSDRD